MLLNWREGGERGGGRGRERGRKEGGGEVRWEGVRGGGGGSHYYFLSNTFLFYLRKLFINNTNIFLISKMRAIYQQIKNRLT